jgi:hypothetical protein
MRVCIEAASKGVAAVARKSRLVTGSLCHSGSPVKRAVILNARGALRDRAVELSNKGTILDCWALLEEVMKDPNTAAVTLLDLEL